MEQQILRRPEVERVTGLSKPTLYRMIASGAFPRPVKLGVRSVGWRASEIERWIEGRPETTGQTAEAVA